MDDEIYGAEVSLEEDQDDAQDEDAQAELELQQEANKQYEHSTIKLDYSLKTLDERLALINKILAETPRNKLTHRYLEILADQIFDLMSREEAKQIGLITPNRMVTIRKRETSYEGLVSKFENGEDGVYNLITEDKNVLLTPKVQITPKDIEEVPGLKQLRETIATFEELYKHLTGRNKFLCKKNIIEMRREQYVLKDCYRQPIRANNIVKSISNIDFGEHITLDENDEPISDGILSFFNYKHISAILCNYSTLKQETQTKFGSDAYYLMLDFDKLAEDALKDYPLYDDLVTYKIDGLQNLEIQALLEQDYGIKHSVEYISSLWRNKIPKLIAEKAKENWLLWHYTYEEYGKWKRCSRCGEIKLAHNRFFSKNKTSKDGFYSICKCCRNKKKV